MEKLKDILGIIYIILAFIFLIYCWVTVVKIAKLNKRIEKDNKEFRKIINEEKAQSEVMKVFNKSLEDNKDEV